MRKGKTMVKRICPNCDGKSFNIIYVGREEYVEDCPMCNGTGFMYESIAKTNGDRIRAMNNEELADWFFAYRTMCEKCIYVTDGCDFDKCKQGMFEWLNSSD